MATTAASTAAGRGHRKTLKAPAFAPRSPRRVSGPARATGYARTPAARPAATRAPRVAEFVRGLPDHRWLDRLVRGRVWIPLLGVLLTGVVAMQVEVLKLGAGVGRELSWATQLQSRNQLLRQEVASLSDEQRIVRLATRLGMSMPGPTEVKFVPAHGAGALGRAIFNITLPAAQVSGASLTTTR